MSDDVQVIDIIADELSLARAQLDSGLAGLAEGTLRRRIAYLDAEGATSTADELDAARLMLAEALYRQVRPIGARAALEAIGSSSSQRRRPIAMLIEAEGLAAAGEPDRAAGLMERVVSAIGVDEAWRLRAGAPTRLPWPLPTELRPEPRVQARPPWVAAGPERATAPARPAEPGPKVAAARARLAAAREAYTAGEVDRGDHELSLGVRLDPAVAPDGVALLETTLTNGPDARRLLLYGDLLRAAGREVDASAAYDRAAQARG